MLKRGFKSWCENAAIGYRREVGVQPNDPLPPSVLAEHLGAQVRVPEGIPGFRKEALHQLTVADPDSWSAVTLRLPAGNLVIVNSAHPATRQANSGMHELAHLLLDHQPARIDVSKDGHLLLQSFNRNQEDEANWLSATLLVPRQALLSALAGFDTAKEVAEFFGVSMELLTWRRRATGVDAQLRRRKTQRSAR